MLCHWSVGIDNAFPIGKIPFNDISTHFVCHSARLVFMLAYKCCGTVFVSYIISAYIYLFYLLCILDNINYHDQLLYALLFAKLSWFTANDHLQVLQSYILPWVQRKNEDREDLGLLQRDEVYPKARCEGKQCNRKPTDEVCEHEKCHTLGNPESERNEANLSSKSKPPTNPTICWLECQVNGLGENKTRVVIQTVCLLLTYTKYQKWLSHDTLANERAKPQQCGC